jgi:hypothetical protein
MSVNMVKKSMPKKTREQKMAASKRRQLIVSIQEKPHTPITQTHSASESTTHPEIISDTSERALRRPNLVAGHELTVKELAAKKYFISDFKKSIMVIALIVALEIIMYFGTMNKYFSF